MADVLGPVSSLPGSLHPVPEGMTCDTPDCGKPATVRVQGETDSFGCEMVDLCDECNTKANSEDGVAGFCEYCHAEDKLVPYRDPDEGPCGPVYWICGGCRFKCRAAQAEEVSPFVLDGICYPDDDCYPGDDELYGDGADEE